MVSIYTAVLCPEDGGSVFFRNISSYLQDDKPS